MARRADEFDVLHFHIDLLHYPLMRQDRRPLPDHAARAARPAGLSGLLHGIAGAAAGVDLDRPAPADAAGQLGRLRPSRPAAAICCASTRHRPATISPSSAASRRRSVPTARSRSPHRPGATCKHRGEDRRRRPEVLGETASSRWCARIRTSSTSARSATPRSRRSSATPRRCCSRSTGASRSGWS